VFFHGVGEGELPTLILLHGFPGGEGDVLGLGERISSGSFNVLTFNFRGVRKSEGTFTFGNSISDVAAAVDYLKRGNISGVDRDRIGVLGWSFGAWVAMMAGAENPEIQCVGAIAPGNAGVFARQIDSDPETRRFFVQSLDSIMHGDRVRGLGGEETVTEMLTYASEYDLVNHASELVRKPVLVVGGWRDTEASFEESILPVLRAIWELEGDLLTPVAIDDGHSFRNHRDELQRIVISWLENECRSFMRY